MPPSAPSDREASSAGSVLIGMPKTPRASAANAPRRQALPYARQLVDEDDVQAVVDVLRGEWLTTGPKVGEFEQAVARVAQAQHAVAVSSGTAALHAAMFAIGLKPGDEVILPTLTFAATANAVVHAGATPRFVDVDEGTLLIDAAAVEAAITPRTQAILGVDYAGQPCDSGPLRAIARRCGAVLIADACHSLGAMDRGRAVGSLADLTVFSFHPAKAITTGEGGMLVTSRSDYADRARRFRNHGIDGDHHTRAATGQWFYDMVDLGLNYRLTDFQSALGLSQLRKLPAWLARRRAIAARYDAAVAEIAGLRALSVRSGVVHARHLYVIVVDAKAFGMTRDDLIVRLRGEGIGANVHYRPVHLHPFYAARPESAAARCPVAEAMAQRIVSLPLFPRMSDGDVDDVIAALQRAAKGARA